MKLLILTPDKELFSGEVNGVTLPGQDGKFQILKGHAPLVASLTEGTVSYDVNGKAEQVTIASGFVEVLNNEVAVLAQGVS